MPSALICLISRSIFFGKFKIQLLLALADVTFVLEGFYNADFKFGNFDYGNFIREQIKGISRSMLDYKKYYILK